MPHWRSVKPAILATALAFSVASAPGVAARTQVLSDIPETGLAKTYAWAQQVPKPASTSETDPRVNNAIIQKRFVTAIDAALTSKGYVRVENPDEAGMLVAYRIGVKDKTQTNVDSFNWGPYPYGTLGCSFAACYGGGYRWGPWGPPDTTVSHFTYAEGQLMIDLMEGTPSQLVWRATRKKRLSHKDSRQGNINHIVAKMLVKLPAPEVPD